MIHVAINHWQDERWIDIQLEYLEKHLPKPYRTYAFLTQLKNDYSDRYDWSSDVRIREHSTKLNLLYDIISFAADSEDDPVLFLDGDAFPIADTTRYFEEDLPKHKLVAIRRDEAGDPHPHPSWCISTVGFWRDLPGDWRKGGGAKWIGAGGREVSDVGARVYKAVEEKNIDWKPLLRTNKRDFHPLFFAIYDDAIYHHGAGFRAARGGRKVILESGALEAEKTLRHRALMALPKGKRTKRWRHKFSPAFQINDRLKEEHTQISLDWYEKAKADREFYKELM